MSFQTSLVIQAIQAPQTRKPETVRRIAKFQPSIWGDRFINYDDSQDTMRHALWKEQAEQLKLVLRRDVFTDRYTSSDFSHRMKIIDSMQRLGVAYHFEPEIESALEHMNAKYVPHNGDLYHVALGFRLLRQDGYNVSSDIFNKFKDANGKFKEALTADVSGMLSFYEATHLRMHGEDILEEGLCFTTNHLEFCILTHVNQSPGAQILGRALERPLRKSPERLYARHYMSSICQDNHPKALHHELIPPKLLKFAKLDFNIVQSLHKKEISEICSWWKELDFVREMPFARNRIVELYCWTVGVFFEPQFSAARKFLTKVISLGSVLDDIYDAYGTYEELKIFTEAIQRWDVSCIDELPEYMKLFYRRLLNVYNEMEEDLVKQGTSYRIHYAVEAMKAQARLYFAEARWLHEGYIPSTDEYLRVAVPSVGNTQLSTTSLVGMGDIVTKEAFEWLKNDPKILRASNIISRLMDDIVSGPFDKEREHVTSAIDCYIKQYGVSEQEAADVFNRVVASSWKDINEAFLRPAVVPMPVLKRILNLTRVVDLLYKGDDGYTRVGHVVKDGVASLLIDPIPL